MQLKKRISLMFELNNGWENTYIPSLIHNHSGTDHLFFDERKNQRVYGAITVNIKLNVFYSTFTNFFHSFHRFLRFLHISISISTFLHL